MAKQSLRKEKDQLTRWDRGEPWDALRAPDLRYRSSSPELPPLLFYHLPWIIAEARSPVTTETAHDTTGSAKSRDSKGSRIPMGQKQRHQKETGKRKITRPGNEMRRESRFSKSSLGQPLVHAQRHEFRPLPNIAHSGEPKLGQRSKGKILKAP